MSPRKKQRSIKDWWHGLGGWSKKIAILVPFFLVITSGAAALGLLRSTFQEKVGRMPFAQRLELEELQEIYAGDQRSFLKDEQERIQNRILQLEDEKKTQGSRFSGWRQDLLKESYKKMEDLKKAIKQIEETKKPVKR